MRELEPMYDIIFQDDKLKKLFLNFHSKNWDNLTVDSKKTIMHEINDTVANLYGYKPLSLKDSSEGYYGSHSSFKDEIRINLDSLKNDSGYEAVDTYFHELRHSFQSRAIEHKLTDKEYASEEQRLEWKKNFLPGNYLSSGEFYKYQAVEKDAWSVGMLFARKIYLLNKQQIKDEDPQWQDYCKLHKDVIVNFISENEKSSELLSKYQSQIEENYDAKIEDEEQFEKGKQYYSEILENKDIDELDFREVAILLSPYTFTNLDIAQKAKLMNRYKKLVKYGNKSYEIKVHTTGAIKLGGRISPTNDSLNMINDLLSFNFKNIVSDIVNGLNDEYELDNKAKTELKLNMFKTKEGKYLNFITDRDNLFMFSLQPYARYESYYVLNELKKIKDIELEAFGKNSSHWKYWEDFYDNKTIYKTASRVMGVPFSKYYNVQLATYRERINEYLHNSKR